MKLARGGFITTPMGGTYRVSAADAGDFLGERLAWDVLRTTARHLQGVPDRIDLRDCLHLKPYAVACIAALGARAGGWASLILPENAECRGHFLRLGVQRFFATDAVGEPLRDTNVEIQQLHAMSGEFSSRAMDLWEREMGGLPVGMKPAFAGHLDELIANALGHSASPVGCLVAGQAFPQNACVELTVLDLGQTILRHLSKHPNHADLKTDHEAIERATCHAVTGTPPGQMNRLGGPNSGVGLYNLRQFCEHGNGVISIISGGAW